MKALGLMVIALLWLGAPVALGFDFLGWKADWQDEMQSADTPWTWALGLHSQSSSVRDSENVEALSGATFERLMAKESLSPEALYWASAFCQSRSNLDDVCPETGLITRLMEIDGENVYSQVLFFNVHLEGKTGIGATIAEEWDWSYFDAWLDEVVGLDRVESYDFHHYSEMVRLMMTFGQTHGIASILKNPPAEWRAAYYFIDNLVYPWHGYLQRVQTHCEMSRYLERWKQVEGCRKLAEKLLDKSRSIRSRKEALWLMSGTYSRDEPEYILHLREAAAWDKVVNRCLDRIPQYARKDWDIAYDARSFVETVHSKGQIVALKELAAIEGWYFEDPSGTQMPCTDIPMLDEFRLVEVLGKSDPARTLCYDGGCDAYMEPDTATAEP